MSNDLANGLEHLVPEDLTLFPEVFVTAIRETIWMPFHALFLLQPFNAVSVGVFVEGLDIIITGARAAGICLMDITAWIRTPQEHWWDSWERRYLAALNHRINLCSPLLILDSTRLLIFLIASITDLDHVHKNPSVYHSIIAMLAEPWGLLERGSRIISLRI